MWPTWEETLLIFAAAVLEGGVGFDFGLIAVPAIGALSGVRDAVVLLCFPNLGLGILKALGGKAKKENLKRFMPFIGAGGVGAAAGVFLLLSTPPAVLKWTVLGLALLFALYSLSWTRFQLDLRDETFFAYIAGFFSGSLTGFSYAGGPVAVI
ncbi:MAG: TSUP family transporter, partial [bacterium]|nr:TSUP family transporter [bacterium]